MAGTSGHGGAASYPSTRGAEAGKVQVQGQPRLQSKTLSETMKRRREEGEGRRQGGNNCNETEHTEYTLNLGIHNKEKVIRKRFPLLSVKGAGTPALCFEKQ